MQAVVKNIHFLIILYTLYSVYGMYDDYQTKKQNQVNEVVGLESKLKKKNREKKQLNTLFKDIEEAKVRVQKVAEEVERIQRQLPSNNSDTENLALLKGVADNLNIRNIFLTPQDEVNKGFYFTKSYNFKASGTFLQFLIFLEKLSTSERLFNVKGIQLTIPQGFQKGRFRIINTDLTIESYRYNPSHKESTGLDEIEKQFNEAPVKRKRGRKRR